MKRRLIFALLDVFHVRNCINDIFLEIILLYAGLFKLSIKILEGDMNVDG